MDFNEDAAARSYQALEKLQKKDGRNFLKEVLPKPGDIVLDMGCETGDLTALLAELVGPGGSATGIDPDGARIKLARATYQNLENLAFAEGSCNRYPGMELAKYDLIFSNYVFHWVPNKQEAFEVAHGSLKPGGRIAAQFNEACPSLIKRALTELFPQYDQEGRLSFESIQTVRQYLMNAGFIVTRLVRCTLKGYFKDMFEFCQWLQASTCGLSDLAPIRHVEQLEGFDPPTEGGMVVCVFPSIQIIGKKKEH